MNYSHDYLWYVTMISPWLISCQDRRLLKENYDMNIRYVLYDILASYHIFLWYQTVAVSYHIRSRTCLIAIMNFQCFPSSVFSPFRVPAFHVSPFGVFRAHLHAYVFPIDCISHCCNIYDWQLKYMHVLWPLKSFHSISKWVCCVKIML